MPVLKRNRLILLSPSGWGNLGDDAILQALTARLLSISATEHIVLATLSPGDSARTIGVPAVPLRGASITGYHVKSQRVARPLARSTASVHESTVSSAANFQINSHTNRLKEALPPLLRSALGLGWRFLIRVRSELRHAVRLWRWLPRTKAIIVSGGGQLDDLWGGPWGHPFTLAFWSLVARIRGVPSIILGVGAGHTNNKLTAAFLKYVISTAAYTSVRDPRSAKVVTDIARLSPVESRDIAFLLTACNAKMRTASDRNRPVIAVSPMAYARPGIWPTADENLFISYISALSSACFHWLDKGYRINLYTTALMDRETSVELYESLVSARPHLRSAIDLVSQTSVDGLLAMLSQADICVTARLHGVILSQLIAVPTIAIVHDWKVSEQMRLAGQGAFAFDVRSLTAVQMMEACKGLLANWHNTRASLHEFACASAKAIDHDIFMAMGHVINN